MENSEFYTQRYFSNYFGIEYSEQKSREEISEIIHIQNFDEKITYLLKAFPYPDMVKIILKKLKFAYFQDKIFLDTIQENCKKEFEEHELRSIIHDLNTFTSNSYYLYNFEGHFYGDHSRVNYTMRDSTQIDIRKRLNYTSINFERNNPTNSDNEINFDNDGYETD